MNAHLSLLRKSARQGGQFANQIVKGSVTALAVLAVGAGAWLAASLISGQAPAASTYKVTIQSVSPKDKLPSSAEVALEDADSSAEGAKRHNIPKTSLVAYGSWFLLVVDGEHQTLTGLTLEVQKAPASQTSAWHVASKETEGASQRFNALQVREGTRGSVIQLPLLREGRIEILLRANNFGARQPKVRIWRRADLDNAENYYRHLNGVTLGVLLFLSAFGALIALIARDKLFLIFAAWSLTSLRTVAINEGWGTNWLFEQFSPELVPSIVGGTLALHCLFTILLFGALFQDHLTTKSRTAAQRTLCSLYILAVLCSPLATSPAYHPAVWTLALLGITFIGTTLFSALRKQWSAVLGWYASFWLVTLAGLAGEIAHAAGIFSKPSAFLNAQTGTTASALVLAVALAQRFVDERLERRRAEDSEFKALQRLATTYSSMPIGLFRMDRSGAIVLFNPSFQKLFAASDASSTTLSALNARELFGEEGSNALMSSFDNASDLVNIVAVRREKVPIRHLQFSARVTDQGLEGSVQDISARLQAEAALARLVDHDVQTEALNQRGLDDAVKRAIRLTQEGVSCAMIEIDVDRFKTLNDLYGHLVGDQLLSAACARLIAAMKPGDEIARIGDSFRIVAFDCDPDSSAAYAKQMHTVISEKPIEVAGRVLTVSASVGVVPIDVGMDARDAIAASSQACAEAKAKGRNRVVHMAKQDLALRGYLEELKVQENLQDKINSQRFFLEYQPIVSFRSAFETLNYEVLVRMRGENGATISPGRFIPAAERNGQMSLIDRWVLLKTLHWLNDHKDHLQRLDYATINLSGASLNDARFVDNTFAMIADFPNVMSKLCFEITETVALADRRATRRFSERVHSMGSKVALDDFGAGYTSFTYLREIEADIIKIDGSFVRDINQNPANHAITRMIVELSHELGKRCVAEWAEHPDVIATLMQLGVDYGQGYALARPMAPEALMFAGSCGDLVTEPTVRALLKGTLSPEQVTASPKWSASQTALF